MAIEEAIKAMQNKQPVYYMGDCYDIVYCKQSTTGDVAIVQRRSLNNRFGPVPIEPMFLSLEANHDCGHYHHLDCYANCHSWHVRLVASV